MSCSRLFFPDKKAVGVRMFVSVLFCFVAFSASAYQPEKSFDKEKSVSFNDANVGFFSKVIEERLDRTTSNYKKYEVFVTMSMLRQWLSHNANVAYFNVSLMKANLLYDLDLVDVANEILNEWTKNKHKFASTKSLNEKYLLLGLKLNLKTRLLDSSHGAQFETLLESSVKSNNVEMLSHLIDVSIDSNNREFFEKLIKRIPDDSRLSNKVRLHSAIKYYGDGEKDKTDEILYLVNFDSELSSSIKPAVQLARVMSGENDGPRAVLLLKKLIASDAISPRDKSYALLLLSKEVAKMGQYESAIGYLENSVEQKKISNEFGPSDIALADNIRKFLSIVKLRKKNASLKKYKGARRAYEKTGKLGVLYLGILLMVVVSSCLLGMAVQRTCQIRKMRKIEPSSGLYHRHYFLERAEHVFKKSKNCILIKVEISSVDLLQKNIDKSEYDSLVYIFSQCVIKSLPDDALICRFSENEIVTLLPNAKADDGEGWVNNMDVAIRSKKWNYLTKCTPLHYSMSMVDNKAGCLSFLDMLHRAQKIIDIEVDKRKTRMGDVPNETEALVL